MIELLVIDLMILFMSILSFKETRSYSRSAYFIGIPLMVFSSLIAISLILIIIFKQLEV